MSSHREAPQISQDPVADNTDTYAFVSPDTPDMVTIVTNYLPAELPSGGPNFFEFGNDVLYSIYIDNDGDGLAEIAYQFQFDTTVSNPNTFLYNIGPITSLDDPTWNRRQFYSVTRVEGDDVSEGYGTATSLGSGLACPPCNIGPRSTPNYAALADEAINQLSSGEKVFAGQRSDPFFVDLGAIFDLGDLRPFQNLHLIPTAAAPGENALAWFNVHSIVIQVPIDKLTRDGSVPKNPLSPKAVLGIWGAAARRAVKIHDFARHDHMQSGPWRQVSRLGNPLFNEVIVPMSQKDQWNESQPAHDKAYLPYTLHPELGGLLPVLYPGVFPHLAGLTAPRVDLEAVFLTGIPAGILPGFQNSTGSRPAEMMRLNTAIPPARDPNPLGLIGGDLQGWPNGRRLQDDVVTIAIRAVAGVTYPLIDPAYAPDGAAGEVTQGVTPNASQYLSTFPYVGTPHGGYEFPSATS